MLADVCASSLEYYNPGQNIVGQLWKLKLIKSENALF